MTKTLLIVENNVSIDKINEILSQNVDIKIIALDYKAHTNLVKYNLKHFFADSYLSPDDKKEIDNLAINKTLFWHQNFSELLTFYHICLPKLIEMELIQFFTRLYLDIFSLIRTIQQENPSKIISHTHLDDFISRICKTRKTEFFTIPFSLSYGLLLDRINIKFNLVRFPISFSIKRKNFQKMKKVFESILNFFEDDLVKSPNKEYMLLLDFNVKIYRNLLTELAKQKKNILLLNQRRPAIWNFDSFKIIKRNNCKVVSLNKFETKLTKNLTDEKLIQLSENLTKIWQNERILNLIFSIDSISFWNSIKSSFIKICDSRFKESIVRIILLNELMSKIKINTILEWAETGQEEKEVLFVSKKYKIKSVMLQHARMPTAEMWKPFGQFLSYFSHPLLSDYQAVWGNFTKDYAITNGHKEKNILITGSPRHDDFFNFSKTIRNKGIILFATTGPAGVASETSTISSYLEYEKFVRKVCTISKNFPDKKLIVKPHPHSENFVNTIELIKSIDPKIPIMINADLPQLISSADVVITFTNSTIAIESLILGKPTISLQIEKWAEEEEISKMGAVLSISNIDEIENNLRNLLYDKQFASEIQNNAKKFLDHYMANGGNASKMLAKEIDRLF